MSQEAMICLFCSCAMAVPGQSVSVQPLPRMVPGYILENPQEPRAVVPYESPARSSRFFPPAFYRTSFNSSLHPSQPLAFKPNELNDAVLSVRAKILQRHGYSRVGGNFWEQFGHSAFEGFTKVGEYNLTMAQLKLQSGGIHSFSPFNPRSMHDYKRNHDPFSWVGRQVLKSMQRSAAHQFRPALQKIVFGFLVQ